MVENWSKIESERDELVQLKERAENENINLKKDFENLEKEFFEIQNIFESQKAEQDDDKKQFDDEISQAGFYALSLALSFFYSSP